MKFKRILTTVGLTILVASCVSLEPATFTKNGEIRDYKYIHISQTTSLTSGSGESINGQYYSTNKSVNPRDVISGILAKEGFILMQELKNELSSETLIATYGESGQRTVLGGLGGYTTEVTIQFISSGTNSLISSCTAEGIGDTEADDIRKAITRCLNSVLSNKTERR